MEPPISSPSTYLVLIWAYQVIPCYELWKNRKFTYDNSNYDLKCHILGDSFHCLSICDTIFISEFAMGNSERKYIINMENKTKQRLNFLLENELKLTRALREEILIWRHIKKKRYFRCEWVCDCDWPEIFSVISIQYMNKMISL